MYRDKFHIKYCPKTVPTKNSNRPKNNISIERPCSDTVKQKNDNLVQNMFLNGEISEPVAEFLQCGQKKLSTYYHLLKTHKIPQNVDNPINWLESQGFPLRGIISARDEPTERLAGFVDYFLQPGMKNLPSFATITLANTSSLVAYVQISVADIRTFVTDVQMSIIIKT